MWEGVGVSVGTLRMVIQFVLWCCGWVPPTSTYVFFVVVFTGLLCSSGHLIGL